jgi:hypothetical protein
MDEEEEEDDEARRLLLASVTDSMLMRLTGRLAMAAVADRSASLLRAALLPVKDA